MLFIDGYSSMMGHVLITCARLRRFLPGLPWPVVFLELREVIVHVLSTVGSAIRTSFDLVLLQRLI